MRSVIRIDKEALLKMLNTLETNQVEYIEIETMKIRDAEESTGIKWVRE